VPAEVPGIRGCTEGLAMFAAVLVVIVNLGVDALSLAVDARTRYPTGDGG
jgi:ABC-type dipeptide/oligopeptide/nickel transport system permease component